MATKTVHPFARQTYNVVVHEAEEGGYWAEVRELPGCVSQGETLEELNRNINEAIEAVLSCEQETSLESHVVEPQVEAGSYLVGFSPTWTAAH